MSGDKMEASPKVRLVRCPKCAEILPEIANVPVYKCGGCDTILQAKNRKNGVEGKAKFPSKSNEPSQVDGYTGSGSSDHDTISPIKEGSSGQENVKLDEREYSDSSNEQGDFADDSLTKMPDSKDQNHDTIFHSNGEQLSLSTQADSESQTIVADAGSYSVASTSNQGLEHESHSLENNEAKVEYPRQSQENQVNNSLSSSPGYDDQCPEENLHSPKNTHKISRSSGSNGKERYLVQGTCSWKKGSIQHDFEIQDAYNGKDDILESNEDSGGFWNRRKVRGDEYHSPENPFFEDEVGSPSKQWNDPDTDYNNRREQLKYVKRLHEFRDHKLRSMNSPGKQIPFCHPEGIYHNMNHPRYYGGLRSVNGWSQQSTRECRYCWCSGQLHEPLPAVQSKGFNGIHPGHHCCNSFSSCSSSPQDCYFGFSHETRSNPYDRKHYHNIYVGDSHSVVKRHVLPTVGGAPFAACYYCLQILQLPADFLVVKKKIHKLKCFGCSKILTFSLQNKTTLVPTFGSWQGQSRESVAESKSRISSEVTESPSKGNSASPDYEVQPRAKGSPLHRLLGYSSVSQVFKRGQLSSSDT